jgi:hypothetical protein
MSALPLAVLSRSGARGNPVDVCVGLCDDVRLSVCVCEGVCVKRGELVTEGVGDSDWLGV